MVAPSDGSKKSFPESSNVQELQDDLNAFDDSSDEKIVSELDTSNLIIGITEVFNSGKGYEATIMGVLDMLSQVVHPDRLVVFERGEHTTSCTFEWHAPNVPSNIALMQNLPNEQFDAMNKLAEDSDTKILTSDLEEMKSVDESMAKRFSKRGVTRMIGVAMRNEGELIGYLSVNNYRLNRDVDTRRILDTVAPFICTKIVNQRLVSRLERLGTHDSLTGLLNRRGIDMAIADRLARDAEPPYALVLIDIDDFKVVNDLHGHDVGDAVLRSLADVVKRVFPSDAILGRNGGDEFLAMVFGSEVENIDEVLMELMNSSVQFESEEKSFPISISVGYASYPQQVSDLQDAYTKADAALYAVKLSGKSGFKRYSPDQDYQYRSKLGFTPRDIADNIPCAVAICKATNVGEMLFANDELAKLLECDSYPELLAFTGSAYEGVVHPDDHDRVLGGLVRFAGAVEGTKTYTDYRILTKTGKVRYVADCCRHVSIEEMGDIVYILVVDKDERKQLFQS